MKTSENQILRQKPAAFLNALGYPFHILIVGPATKMLLIIDSILTFFSDVGVVGKSFLQVMIFTFVLNPALHFFLLLDDLRTFCIDSGINWKKVEAIAFVIFFAISSVFLFKLFIRALDVEADAQEIVLIEYKESLKNSSAAAKGN